MKEVVLYHGSNVAVAQPQILVSGFYKDFGYGFYCTKLEKQARKWALTKQGSITREAFWILAKFKYPTHQIVFCTQKVLEALTYERSISL